MTAPDQGEPTVLLLVRHGRTEFTEEGRFSGPGGLDVPLSPGGSREALRIAALLACVGHVGSPLLDIAPISTVISSPLQRTRQTAEVIAEQLGLGVVVDDAWVEAAFGDWDGLTVAEVARRDPDLLRRWRDSGSAGPPGGESRDAAVDRMRAARRATTAAYERSVVAVITHATPVRVAVAEALEGGPSALWRTRVDPGSVTAVRYWADGGVEVMTVNTRAPEPARGP